MGTLTAPCARHSGLKPPTPHSTGLPQNASLPRDCFSAGWRCCCGEGPSSLHDDLPSPGWSLGRRCPTCLCHLHATVMMVFLAASVTGPFSFRHIHSPISPDFTYEGRFPFPASHGGGLSGVQEGVGWEGGQQRTQPTPSRRQQDPSAVWRQPRTLATAVLPPEPGHPHSTLGQMLEGQTRKYPP